MLHQSPCCVPGTRRMNETPFPVMSALAGQSRTCCRHAAIPTSSTAHVASERRICAIETRKSKATWPRICREKMTAARCRRGSRSLGRRIGYARPRNVSDGPRGAVAAGAAIAISFGSKSGTHQTPRGQLTKRNRFPRRGRLVQRLDHSRLRDRILAAEQKLALAADRVAEVLELQAVRVHRLELDPLNSVFAPHLDHRLVAVPRIVEEERAL